MLRVSKLGRTELLRDVFVWADERSCQRYPAIRQSMGGPDAFCRKYQAALAEVAQLTVSTKLRGTADETSRLATGFDVDSDMPGFVEAILSGRKFLYDGNIARYKKCLSEFRA